MANRAQGQYYAQSDIAAAAGSLAPGYGLGWRVLRVQFLAGGAGGTVTIKSPKGDDLTVSALANQTITLEPKGNKPAETVDYTGNAAILVEWVR